MSKTNFCIPKPCHEDWNLMTPKEQGRYCDSCDKVVTDFTKMSKEEIIIYLKTHQNVCGTFQKSQLPKTLNISIPYKTLHDNSHNAYKLFFLTLLISMGSTLFSCKNYGQTLGEIQLIEETDSVKQIEINSAFQNDSILLQNTKKDNSKHCSAKSRAEFITEKTEEELITGDVLYEEDFNEPNDTINDQSVN